MGAENKHCATRWIMRCTTATKGNIGKIKIPLAITGRRYINKTVNWYKKLNLSYII